MYEYRAVVVDVHDGDTFKADVDLGQLVTLAAGLPDEIDLGLNAVLRREGTLKTRYRVWMRHLTFRLNRLNAPEVTGSQRPQGLASRTYVVGQIAPGSTVWIRTIKDEQEKYGRWLAEVYPTGFAGVCLNDEIVQAGFALYWDGSGPRPV